MIKCKFCEKEFSFLGFSSHCLTHDITSKEYYDKFLKKENEGICLSCGNPTNFKNINIGYYKFCSTKCMSKNEKIKQCIKKTKQEKYGDENYINIEKMKKTKLEKYGDENFTNRKKCKKTTLERYGVENIGIITRDKSIASRNRTKINEINDIIDKNSISIKLIEYHSKIESIYFCNVCNNYFSIQNQLFNKRLQNKETICIYCNPKIKGTSKQENEILDFIKQNYIKEIITNSRNIIFPYELDIYLPDLKLAFEFNGLYWHSELNKPNNYHLEKTNKCEEQGIHLVQIYEDDWNFKQEIVKSRILNLINKSKKIFARKCEIKELQFNESKEFLKSNHLQGSCVDKIRLGLYYENVLVSVMTFGKLRKNLGQTSKDGSWELLRFCNKLGYSVIGGANRLFHFFIKKFKPFEIISYADRSWTSKTINTLYERLNFKKVGITLSNYYYIVDGLRINRFNFRKDILKRNGFDINKSEHEIMLKRGIYRIYDSGQLKYIWRY